MIRSFVFSQGKLLSQDVTLQALRAMLGDEDVQIWVDAEAPTPEETKALLEDTFLFHALAIEDCVNVSERPKVDEYENSLFMVIHEVDFSARGFRTTELNLFVGKNFLVTFHRDPLKSVSSTIDRVMKNVPLVARAPDRLTYTILNAVLESYDPSLENLSTEVAELEQRVLKRPSAKVLDDVITLKSEVQRLRQIIFPQREVIARVAHGEFKVVRSHLLPYYRDLLDQLARIGDMADSYRDSLTGVMQVHLNLQQMQVNQVTKVLTVLATLAVPILAVTSFYGMNIQHVPDSTWPWRQAYGFVFGVTLVLTLVTYLILRRKGWM